MKKKISIFWNIALSQLIIIFIAEAIILAFANSAIYRITYNHCYYDIKKSTAAIEYIISQYNLDDAKQAEKCNAELSELCVKLDSPYIYAIELDEAANSETYLAIGFGDKATEEARQSRYSGYVVKGKIKPEMLEALKSNSAQIAQTNNKFGNTLICYQKLHNDSTNTRFVGVEKPISDVINELKTLFSFVLLISLFLTVVIVLSFSFIVYRKVTRPAREISEKMSNFVSQRTEESQKLDTSSEREFSLMAEAFNSMTDEINQYIDDIETLNREKHIQEAELTIANNIQQGLLSPESLSKSGVSVKAFMRPAKEVGGDMYDYHVHDNGEVYFAVADVSGKGVSASLFMARALTLLQVFAKLRRSPAKTAEDFNDMLSRNNPKKLFITAFIGAYNPKTKTLTYTNIGHNPPYLISDELIKLDGAHGMAAGIFPNTAYEEAQVTFKEGDTLFVYTDGVNEAENENGEMFSTERLEKLLAKHTQGDRKAIVDDVNDAIKEFSEGAVQSDDITMLSVTLERPFERELHLKSDVNELPKINDLIDEIPDLSFDDNWNLKLMAEEIFVNICSYSYPDSIGDVDFSIKAQQSIEITFEDNGAPYDPTKNPLDIKTYDHNNTVGGLGKFIALNTADSFSYSYENGKNILKLIKKRS